MQRNLFGFLGRPSETETKESTESLRVRLTEIRSLFREWRQQIPMQYDSRTQSIQLNQATRVRGLTRLLRERLDPESRLPNPQLSRARFARSSRVHGNRVHRQLYHLIQCSIDGHCQCSVKTHVNRLSRDTEQILLTLSDMRIVPVAAEFPVLHEASTSFGTFIDIVGLQHQTDLVLVSVKTGGGVGSRQWNQSTTLRFAKPLDQVPLSVRSLNQIQLFVEHGLLKEWITHHRPDSETPLQWGRSYVCYSVSQQVGTTKRKREPTVTEKKKTNRKRRKLQPKPLADSDCLFLDNLVYWNRHRARQHHIQSGLSCYVEPAPTWWSTVDVTALFECLS